MNLSTEGPDPANYGAPNAKEAYIRFGVAHAVFTLSCTYGVLLLQIHFLYRDLQASVNITIINKYTHAYMHIYTNLSI